MTSQIHAMPQEFMHDGRRYVQVSPLSYRIHGSSNTLKINVNTHMQSTARYRWQERNHSTYIQVSHILPTLIEEIDGEGIEVSLKKYQKIDHYNVEKIFGYQSPYWITAPLDGIPLSYVYSCWWGTKKPIGWSVADCVSIMVQTLRACHAIRRVLSQIPKIQPISLSSGFSLSDITIDEDGRIQIINVVDTILDGIYRQTARALVVGNIHLLSFEQIRGLPPDERTDVFLVAMLLYPLFSGEELVIGDSMMERVQKIVRGEWSNAHHKNVLLPPALSSVLNKMIAHQTEQRFATLDDAANAWEEASIASKLHQRRSSSGPVSSVPACFTTLQKEADVLL